jgi:pyruvate dehydrogenase E2 component (dihydrolipoamide acetyltransferase)
MARPFVLPDLGEGLTEAEIVKVLVREGDVIQEDAPLLEVETDKATVEIPSPVGGRVETIHVAANQTVRVGQVLVTFADAAPGKQAADTLDPTRTLAPETKTTVGNGRARQTAPPAPAAARAAASTTPAAPRTGPVPATPATRRLARELGVDLATVTGSGRKGRILKADVEAAAKGGAPAAAPAPSKGAAVGGLEVIPWPKVDFEKFGEVERVALSRIKRISGPALHRNWVTIPHVTHNDEADITELEAFRKRTNDEIAKSGVKVTMVALLLKACIPALQRFPELNSSLEGDELVLKRYYHLGFAADTPQGLVVPVIKDVDEKGLVDIARELTELSGKAREGKLGPSDMAGGTFTISSLGGLGGTSFTPIVNAPEVAILGVTRSAMKPVWNGSEFVPRLMVPLSLSYDHRVIDGALAARFTTFLVSVLSDLRRVLL